MLIPGPVTKDSYLRSPGSSHRPDCGVRFLGRGVCVCVCVCKADSANLNMKKVNIGAGIMKVQRAELTNSRRSREVN